MKKPFLTNKPPPDIGGLRIIDVESPSQRMSQPFLQQPSHDFCFSDKLDPAGGEHHHLDEQPAMTPALYVCCSVGAITVPDRQVDNFQIQPGRSKQQVKITEGVKVSKVFAVGRDLVIVGSPQRLGAAKRIFERLLQQPRERQTEEFVADQ